MLPSGTPAFVPRDLCHTTEPLRRSCIPALGLLPLCQGAGTLQESCPGLVPPQCEGAGAPKEWAPVPAQQEEDTLTGSPVFPRMAKLRGRALEISRLYFSHIQEFLF
ncbi:unnamed protein product [Gulo gulo]|uniref:Uncharacterized protein n=1 Tax=Gulo gulo TaxID=48420 RepID=A0A9X9Q741_GULGU|nr:unnamed protein product [Gulo gulo]